MITENNDAGTKRQLLHFLSVVFWTTTDPSKFNSGQKFTDEVLLSLARKVKIPDVEFIFNVGVSSLLGPVVSSFCSK